MLATPFTRQPSTFSALLPLTAAITLSYKRVPGAFFLPRSLKKRGLWGTVHAWKPYIPNGKLRKADLLDSLINTPIIGRRVKQ
jgi:hypothetical protein